MVQKVTAQIALVTSAVSRMRRKRLSCKGIRHTTNSQRRKHPAMQAGLVNKRLAWSDIFTAGGLTLSVFVAIVHVSVTVQLTESAAAELSTRCSPSARKQAA